MTQQRGRMERAANVSSAWTTGRLKGQQFPCPHARRYHARFEFRLSRLGQPSVPWMGSDTGTPAMLTPGFSTRQFELPCRLAQTTGGGRKIASHGRRSRDVGGGLHYLERLPTASLPRKVAASKSTVAKAVAAVWDVADGLEAALLWDWI